MTYWHVLKSLILLKFTNIPLASFSTQNTKFFYFISSFRLKIMENLTETQLNSFCRVSVTKLVEKNTLSLDDTSQISGVSHEVYEVNNGIVTKCCKNDCLAMISVYFSMYQYNWSYYRHVYIYSNIMDYSGAMERCNTLQIKHFPLSKIN